MPYFFIVPVFGIVILLLGGFALACRTAPSLRPPAGGRRDDRGRP